MCRVSLFSSPLPQAGDGTKQPGFFVNINQSVTWKTNLPCHHVGGKTNAVYNALLSANFSFGAKWTYILASKALLMADVPRSVVVDAVRAELDALRRLVLAGEAAPPFSEATLFDAVFRGDAV